MTSAEDPRFVKVPASAANTSRAVKTEQWRIFSLGLLFAPLLIVILSDRRVWSWDEAYYAEYSVWLFRTLLHSPTHWPAAMLKALVDRAPAISWLGQFFVPLGYLLPYTQTGLLCFVLLTQLASILCLYKLLSRVFDDKLSALLSCCVVASGPLFTGLTYRYFVEPLQLLAVVWVLALVAYRVRLSRPVLALQVIAAIAFGLLAKTSTPLFQFPVLVYLAFIIFKQPDLPVRDHRRNGLFYGALSATVLIVAGTAWWYLINYRATMQHVVEAASGSLAIYYGSKGALSIKLIWWLLQFQKAFLWAPLLFALGLVLVWALFKRSKKGFSITSADLLALLSTSWICVVLLLFAHNINEDTRYLLPLLPYVAIIVCWAVTNVQSRKALLFLLGLSLLQFVRVTVQVWGDMPPQQDLSPYLQAYVRDDRALLDTIFCAAQTMDSSPEHPTLVGEELPEFNGVGLSFYGVLQSHAVEPGKWSYRGFDWTLTDANQAWERVSQIPFRYYVFRKHDASLDSDFLNRLTLAEFDRVSRDPGFRLRTDKSNERVLVYERTNEKSLVAARPRLVVLNPFSGVNPLQQLPFGVVDYPRTAASVNGQLALPVIGWAASTSGIDRVTVAIDSGPPLQARKQSRPDVVKAYPNVQSTGYQADLEVIAIPDGDHRITATAFGRDGSSRVLADFPVTMHFDFPGVNPEAQKPFGLLEYPKSGATLDKTFPLFGWSVVPSGFGSIEVLMDGRPLKNAERQSRPDVAKAYPAYHSSSGFKTDVNVTSSPAGEHRLTVISRSKTGLSRILAQVSIAVR